ncbi:hypothetical protein [Bradyrhizobium sp. AUGA SZCCT0431]|nr:hypothetical protein [Bradyrhizobium sp. AUGA SZCCT0431]
MRSHPDVIRVYLGDDADG